MFIRVNYFSDIIYRIKFQNEFNKYLKKYEFTADKDNFEKMFYYVNKKMHNYINNNMNLRGIKIFTCKNEMIAIHIYNIIIDFIFDEDNIVNDKNIKINYSNETYNCNILYETPILNFVNNIKCRFEYEIKNKYTLKFNTNRLGNYHNNFYDKFDKYYNFHYIDNEIEYCTEKKCKDESCLSACLHIFNIHEYIYIQKPIKKIININDDTIKLYFVKWYIIFGYFYAKYNIKIDGNNIFNEILKIGFNIPAALREIVYNDKKLMSTKLILPISSVITDCIKDQILFTSKKDRVKIIKIIYILKHIGYYYTIFNKIFYTFNKITQ